MPLKDSTETKRWAVKNVEEVGWAVGQIDRTAELEKLGAIIVSAKFTGWR